LLFILLLLGLRVYLLEAIFRCEPAHH